MLLLATLVWLLLGSPFLFQQQRPGRNEVVFTLHKFRSMNERCDSAGTLLPDSERLTRFGRLLRRVSLDELPQLWNVVRGDMSLIGPRPLLVQYIGLYSPEQRTRHAVRPGITGWAQVHGRNATSWNERFQHDIWYVRHLSFWLDVRILWLTLIKVLRSEGVSQQGHVTMRAFQGNAATDQCAATRRAGPLAF